MNKDTSPMESNSLKQYLDFFDTNRGLIDANSAPAINSVRIQAREALEDVRLPRKGDEGYERISVNDMLAPDFGINAGRVDIPADVAASFRCDVPMLSTALGVVVNDRFVPTRAVTEKLPEGVRFMSLRRAAEEMPDLVAPYLQLPADNPMAMLNQLLLQDGVLLHVSAGVQLQKPLQLVNIFSASIDLMAVRRLLVIIERGASARLLVCDHTQDRYRRYMSLQVVQVHLGRDSHFEIYDLEESSPLTSRHSTLYSTQESGSSLTINGSTLSGGVTRNDYSVDLEGEGSRAMLAGFVIASDVQITDNSSVVRHRGERTHSNQLFKYVLDDKSTGAFEGLIVVDEKARFTEAYQTNRNLLASSEARMHTRPQLEIYCDDVKCSHGAATGQLDSNALFYMRTRGIPEAQAQAMLRQAFMGDVIDTVGIEGLRERLRMLVERRFNGIAASCADCGSCVSPINEGSHV